MNWEFPYYTEEVTDDYWNNLASKYDWIKDMADTEQDAIYHAEGNVATHTRMVLTELLNDPEFQKLDIQEKHILFASAMFHDVEKRSTTVIEENGRITSKGHSKRGETTTRQILYRDIETPFLIREHICKLIRFHGTPLWAINRNNPAKSVIEVSVLLNTKLLEMLARADVNGRTCDDKNDLLERIELFRELCIENECYGTPREFETNLSRYTYLNKGGSPDYVPFDDKAFKVYLMSAVAGSGKDTWINNNLKDIEVISLDDMRRELKIKSTDKKKNGQVVQAAKEKAREFLREGKSFIWNGTNITRQLRKQLVDLFLTYGADVEIVYIETPYKTLLKQNHNREHKVPENVIEKMIKKLEVPVYSEAINIKYVVSG